MLPKAFAAALNWLESYGKRHSADDYLWLLRLGEHWPFWWKKISVPSAQDPERDEKLADRSDLEEIVNSGVRQTVFITKLRSWAEEKWGKRHNVGDWMLLSLADQEPFDKWSEMRRHYDQALTSAPGAYLVFVPDGRPIDERDIVRLTVWLLPVLEGETKEVKAHQLNFTLADPDAEHAPLSVIEGLRRTLKHLSTRWFWLWILYGGLLETRPERALFVTTTAFCLALLGLFHFAPRSYLDDEVKVLLWATGFIGSVAFLIAYLTRMIKRKYDRVAADTDAWLALLEDNRLGMILSRDDCPRVDGGSFGVTLALGALLALTKAAPPQSDFLRRLIHGLQKCSKSYVFTGKILENGDIGEVNDCYLKMIAAQKHDEISVFVMPKQVHDSIRSTTRVSVSPGAATRHDGPITPLHGAAVSASTNKQLAVKSFGTLSQLLFDVGVFRNYITSGLLAVSMGLAGLAGWASYDVWKLIDRPAPPKILSASLKLKSNGAKADLGLQIDSNSPHQLCASIYSHHWVSTTRQRFYRDGRGNVRNDFNLQRSSFHRLGPYDGLIEIFHCRGMLWRDLPPKEIRSDSLWERTVE